MSYRSLECPHCNTKLGRNKVMYGSYGCPIKICTECGHTLIDPAIKEPALKTPFAFRATVLLDMFRIALAVWAMCLVFAYFVLELIWDAGHGWPMVICGTAICVVLLFVRYMRAPMKPEEIRQLIEESIERLDDPEYANFLASAEIYIYEESMYCLKRGKGKANANAKNHTEGKKREKGNYSSLKKSGKASRAQCKKKVARCPHSLKKNVFQAKKRP